MKIFGIGLNRTGTGTLHRAAQVLGFRSLHWSPHAFDMFEAGDIDGLLNLVDDYDCLTDWPWPLMVGELIQKYGAQARFVLTVRSSEAVWLKSIQAHALHNDNEKARSIRRSIYAHPSPEARPDLYLQAYRTHNQQIEKALTNRGDSYFKACWEDHSGWEGLCAFLGRPVPSVPFPHYNRAIAPGDALKALSHSIDVDRGFVGVSDARSSAAG